MRAIRIELNLTLACNHRCPSCNRLCDRFPKRTCHMSIDQMDRLVAQARRALVEGRARIKRVKVVGGEPLLHPDYPEIHARLCAAADGGVFQSVKIQSNGIRPIPKGLATSPRVRFSGKAFSKREHLQLFSPQDMGPCAWWPGCLMLTRCGASLDAYGWLPCSAAIAIVGAFGLEHLYRDELPTEPWGLAELCRHCPNALPAEIQKYLTKPFSAKHEMSASWAAAIEGWDGLPRKAMWS